MAKQRRRQKIPRPAFKPNRYLFLTGAVAAMAGALFGRAWSEAPDAQAHLGAQINTLRGFDRCAGTSISTMQQLWDDFPWLWWTGIYAGGLSMGSCAVHNASWVNSVESQGWGIAFIWVPRQAPCTSYQHRMSWDPGTAYDQGRAAAQASFNQITEMGVDETGSVQYVDIEPYDSNNVDCRTAVNAFIKGWHQQLEDWFDKSGLYSNSADGIRGLVLDECWEVNGCPRNVWMANWNGQATVWGDPFVADNYWSLHQRLHQYGGPSRLCNPNYCWPGSPNPNTWVDKDCALAQVAGGQQNHYPSSDGGLTPQQAHPACP